MQGASWEVIVRTQERDVGALGLPTLSSFQAPFCSLQERKLWEVELLFAVFSSIFKVSI